MKIEIVFGRVLKHFRSEKRLSQEKIALLSDLDRTYISLLERGLRQPSLKTIIQLSDALGIPAAKLIAAVESEIHEDTSD